MFSVCSGSSPSTCQLSFPSEEACESHRALASRMSCEHVADAVEYALRKLINDCYDREPQPLVKLRIFYQVNYFQ
ncbi:hypothetical protein RR48_00293 [Papilio machaon]|uniref:Uncharacterized protein n=1 Tax=Papilio machaon TaxID=76193 RepID=A0A0N0PF78_PAPMA|nr:hypothetical protein RR48_00293 [Papilio machaon]